VTCSVVRDAHYLNGASEAKESLQSMSHFFRTTFVLYSFDFGPSYIRIWGDIGQLTERL